MVQTLQSRFLAAEEHFLAAFTAGPQAMAAFDDTWTSLSVEFKSAMNIQQVDSQTSRIADTVASRIAILSEHLLALHSQVDTLSTTFKSRCLDILSCANADPPPTAHAPSVAPTSPTVAHPPSSFPYSNSGFGVPSLDMLASQWLLANLHDPYPSSFLKNSWASSCGCSVKDVQVWFAEARQHIGWTALAREKFAGCRRDTSEVASRAYSEDQGQLNLPCDVRRAFTAIRTNADRFVQSISSTPNDIKPEEGFSMGGEDLRTPQRNNLGEVQKQFLSFSDSHHPSPIIVSSSLSDGDEEEDTTPPPSIAGHKRRLDRSDNNMQEQAELLTDPRPTKRHRCSSSTPLLDGKVTSCGALESHRLPPCSIGLNPGDHVRMPCSTISPPRLSYVRDEDIVANESDTPADVCPALPSTTPRKRRLSDAGGSLSMKRPRGPLSLPRPHAVSDPLPTSFNRNAMEILGTDEWFHSSIASSSAVVVDDGDASLFDLEAAGLATSLQSARTLLSRVSQVDVPDADLVSATTEGFDLSDPQSTDQNYIGPEYSSFQLNDLPASFPFFSGSTSDFAECGSIDHASNVDWNQDWSQDWTQFLDIINSLGSSPASSQSSSSDLSPLSGTPSDFTSPASSDDMSRALFGVDPSFSSSDLLSDIGEFSSLHIPLEAMFSTT